MSSAPRLPVSAQVASIEPDAITRKPELSAALLRLQSRSSAALVLAIILFAIGLITFGWALFQFTPKELDKLGGFLSGTVGPIWAASGLLLIYIAFLGQQRQTLLQEDDLAVNRAELRNAQVELQNQNEQMRLQRSEMVNQNATLLKQAFENTFFQLLGVQNSIIQTMRASPSGRGSTPREGRFAFDAAAAELKGRYINSGPDPTEPEQQRAYVTRVFGEVCLAPDSEFGHYFRTLYHLIRFVHERAPEDAARYTALVRAQLSAPILELLFFNCISDYGWTKFKPLVEQYAFLEHMPHSDPIPRLMHLYAEHAYGERVPDARGPGIAPR